MQNTPTVYLHPEAIKSFDEKGKVLLSKVVRQPWKPRAKSETQPRFIPAATFTLDDSQPITESTRDRFGKTLEMFRRVDKETLGLKEEGYRRLRLLAESIQKTEGFRDRVSQKSLESAIFDWVIDRSLNRASQALCERLLAEFQFKVRQLWIWVPIYGFTSDFDFELGRVEIHPFRAAFFDTWKARVKQRSSADESMLSLIESNRRRLQGHGACTIRLVAEPERGREIALAETENALAILRIYQSEIMHPDSPSFLRPLHREYLEGNECFVIEDNEVSGQHSGTADSPEYLVLDDETMTFLNGVGFGALHFMYREENKSNFDKDLWRSLWTYSRSSLQKSPEDRLIYVFRALESFLLQDKAQPIQQSIAERIAFTVSESSEERRRIVRTIIKAYGIRSDIVHHDQRIEELEDISEFLMIAWKFFFMLINNRKQYTSRVDFFESVDRKKYS